MTRESVEKLIQKVLPSFRITGEVGKGSYGAVYRIQDDLKERVAKVVPLHASVGIEKGQVVSADTKLERDFRHIVESYERIACDEIVSVYDFYMQRDENNEAYALIIMEIYPSSLDGFIISHFEETGRPLEIAVATNIINKVAVMLSNLYTKTGFLFEDFKPDNILIKDHLGDLKLVVGDIGGLKNVVSIALTGSQVTPTYCAPEVLRKGQVPGMQSIVYSYGLLCFFILEGHLPYEEEKFNKRIDLVHEKGVPYSRTDVPENIKRVIEKCLAFELENRFTTFEEAVQALKGQMPISSPAAAFSDDAFAGETITVAGKAAPAPVDAASFAAGTITIGGAPPTPTPAPSAPVGGGLGTVPMEPKTVRMSRKPVPRKSASGGLDTVSISDEKDIVSGIKKEIKGRVIRKGEVIKINNENYKIVGNIVVERNAVLSLVNAKLFFGENAGITVLGAIRAKNTLFSAIDVAKKWNNVMIYSTTGGGVSTLEDCRFHFGKGVSGKVLNDSFNINKPSILPNGFYGGGLFIAGGTDKTVKVKSITCYKCSAHDGGGMYFHRSKVDIEGCLFEGCTAIGSGGGIATFESKQMLKGCTFNKCSAGKDGGGICFRTTHSTLDSAMLRGCLSRYYGGGVACLGSSPTIKNSKFEMCRSTKSGGGIYVDATSKPIISFPSYLKCKPNDTNVNS